MRDTVSPTALYETCATAKNRNSAVDTVPR
jgi:hypothetical protein